jgi:hypothetical protein
MSHFDDGALHAYLDRELSPVERERLEAHLADCAPCRARLDEERGLVERASQLLGLAQPPGRAAPPPQHQLRQPRLVWRLRMPLAWAATVVLAVGFGYFLGGTSYRGAPPVAASESIRPSGPPTSSPPASEVVVAQRGAEHRTPETARARADVEAGREVDRPAAANVRVDAAPAPAAEPRAAALPLYLDGVVVASAEAGRVAARDQVAATEWPIIEREPARALLGADPVGVPGLPIRELRRSPAGDGVVLVEQQVDSATVIQLFQRRVEAERQAAREAAPAAAMKAQVRGYTTSERLARFVGSVRVEIAGPLPADSLNKLLERVKPIP